MKLQNNLRNTNCLIDTCNHGTSQLTRGRLTAPAKLLPSSGSSVTLCSQQEQLVLCFSCTQTATHRGLDLARNLLYALRETLIYSDFRISKMPPYLGVEEKGKQGKRENTQERAGASLKSQPSSPQHVAHPLCGTSLAALPDTRNYHKQSPRHRRHVAVSGSASRGSIWHVILYFETQETIPVRA